MGWCDMDRDAIGDGIHGIGGIMGYGFRAPTSPFT
jgi:hypothetical protein